MKRIVPVLLSIVSLMALASTLGACGNTAETVSGDTVTVDNIASHVQEATPNLKTYTLDMEMTMGMKGEIGGEAGDITMTLTAEGSVDANERKMGMDMTLNVSGTGGGEKIDEAMALSTYVVGDTMYVGTEVEGGKMQWQTQSAPSSTWDQQNQMEQQMKLFASSQIKSLKVETVEGVQCYRVELSPDADTLWEMVGSQFGEATSGLETADIKDSIKSMSARYWFTKDKFFLQRGYVYMEMQLTAAQLGETGSGSLDMTVDLTIDFRNHNQSVNIVLPAEASAAH